MLSLTSNQISFHQGGVVFQFIRPTTLSRLESQTLPKPVAFSSPCPQASNTATNPMGFVKSTSPPHCQNFFRYHPQNNHNFLSLWLLFNKLSTIWSMFKIILSRFLTIWCNYFEIRSTVFCLIFCLIDMNYLDTWNSCYLQRTCQVRNMSRRGNYLQENYRRCQKSIETLSNMYRCRFWIILVSADVLCI